MSEKKIGRPKVNPNYNPEAAKDELANAVAELYLHPSSDMEVDKDGHARMKSLQLRFGLTMTKIRKLLVSAGVYHFYKNGTDMVEAVQKLYNEGHTIEEIKSKLHIGTSTINSFLPYKIGTYKADFTADDYDFANVSAEARRKRNQRKREKMKDPKAVGLREENIKKMEKQRKIKDMKAKHKAENEARHQANLERKRAYQERKALKERNDPGNYFWLIKQAREAGIESHARHLERSRDVYLRREAGEVIPQKVASAYINNDPLPADKRCQAP